MRNRNTHESQGKDAGGAGLSRAKRTTKQMPRKTTSRGEHRGRGSGKSSRRRSGSQTNAS